MESDQNFYRNYSIQGHHHQKSYLHLLNANNLSIAFLGVDACPEPGLRRPFNFIGTLRKDEQNAIEYLEEKASQKADHIVWFGHYPTSTILWLDKHSSKFFSFKDLISHSEKSLAYLCGHLHTMGGFAENMYTLQKQGFLELELSDWKDNRKFRLAAIDHGSFSFVDSKHNAWPLILVTNPKSAMQTVPGREPSALIKTSTHIRILVFSKIVIKEVKVKIEDMSWKPCHLVKGPLYACKWDPSVYDTGILNLKVEVKEKNGHKTIINHKFSLDNSVLQFEVQSRFLLMSDATSVFQAAFAAYLLISVVPLCILRLTAVVPRTIYFRKTIIRLWLISKIDKLFFPLILYAAYLPLGPWSIGELVEGEIGAIFAWGIIVNKTFLPGAFTYAYGAIQLFLIHLPLIFTLALCVERRASDYNNSLVRKIMLNLPFILILSFQMLLAYFFWLAYGTMALIIGPMRTWSIILNLYLWYTAISLPRDRVKRLLRRSTY